MSDEIKTGPELYEEGLRHLSDIRAMVANPPDAVDFRDVNEDGGAAYDSAWVGHQATIATQAAVAQACFAGAHAAAFGQLASDAAHDEGNTELSAAWATAIGAPVKDAE